MKLIDWINEINNDGDQFYNSVKLFATGEREISNDDIEVGKRLVNNIVLLAGFTTSAGKTVDNTYLKCEVTTSEIVVSSGLGYVGIGHNFFHISKLLISTINILNNSVTDLQSHVENGILNDTDLLLFNDLKNYHLYHTNSNFNIKNFKPIFDLNIFTNMRDTILEQLKKDEKLIFHTESMIMNLISKIPNLTQLKDDIFYIENCKLLVPLYNNMAIPTLVNRIVEKHPNSKISYSDFVSRAKKLFPIVNVLYYNDLDVFLKLDDSQKQSISANYYKA